ncbi:MAG: aspartate dehydrogenase [Lachnospiraceae bacterium]|nr:aspartate dehydrogenase [Lachnospiraceae bacterium]
MCSGKRKLYKLFLNDKKNWNPVIKYSICNGEKVAGFQHIHTGDFKEECLIRSEKELQEFKAKYGIAGEVEKIY